MWFCCFLCFSVFLDRHQLCQTSTHCNYNHQYQYARLKSFQALPAEAHTCVRPWRQCSPTGDYRDDRHITLSLVYIA
ncbi:hypothetical protein ACN38_g6842 [Penicillium nordicum]|uniref:Secreted protein n=1 Tax=Penicillium nordicum TaxID=229535 RepID=A0A0M9WEX1_9EURO|nr:hypothetical protein ACN38_g6842 [Penicillium nordicum]